MISVICWAQGRKEGEGWEDGGMMMMMWKGDQQVSGCCRRRVVDMDFHALMRFVRTIGPYVNSGFKSRELEKHTGLKHQKPRSQRVVYSVLTQAWEDLLIYVCPLTTTFEQTIPCCFVFFFTTVSHRQCYSTS